MHHMRGGTLTEVMIWGLLLPSDERFRNELIRHLMGVHQPGQAPGNRQVSALGRGPATSQKVFLASIKAPTSGRHLIRTLAQVASNYGDIDWSANCGNMPPSLALWTIDISLIEQERCRDLHSSCR
ncbi:PrpF domain-containing protein [Pseudomonas sp. NyZ201]|uniref:PrpF domain-containing protein n=1 Tax=Pseudomonas sp. NyZ201 TaxID=3409857 RepID=UPI003CEC4634